MTFMKKTNSWLSNTDPILIKQSMLNEFYKIWETIFDICDKHQIDYIKHTHKNSVFFDRDMELYDSEIFGVDF